MIGVVGSADSTVRMQQVAADLSMSDLVLVRSYDRLAQAADLAAELDSVCNVLLFTGLVPYELTRERYPGLHSRAQYVPHGGIDLYRTLALLLSERQGILPRMSIDTIPADLAREGFADLGLEPPDHVLSIESSGTSATRPTVDVVAFHQRLFSKGEVELCLTCLGSVARELEASGVPTVRVQHTKSALRDSLVRAALTDRLVRGEDAQTAVAAIKADLGARGGRRKQRASVEALAAVLHGTAAEENGGLHLIHSTRGSVERLLARCRWQWWQLGGEIDAPAHTRFGFGVGATVADAEANARRSLQLAGLGGELHLVRADGAIVNAATSGGPEGLLARLRYTDDRVLAHARELGLSAMTLARLAAALRNLEVTGFTARELADVYGVETRSARRLLTTLMESGVASEAGHQGGPGAGRPQTVYRIDVEKLVSSP